MRVIGRPRLKGPETASRRISNWGPGFTLVFDKVARLGFPPQDEPRHLFDNLLSLFETRGVIPLCQAQLSLPAQEQQKINHKRIPFPVSVIDVAWANWPLVVENNKHNDVAWRRPPARGVIQVSSFQS